eukprot:350571_1
MASNDSNEENIELAQSELSDKDKEQSNKSASDNNDNNENKVNNDVNDETNINNETNDESNDDGNDQVVDQIYDEVTAEVVTDEIVTDEVVNDEVIKDVRTKPSVYTENLGEDDQKYNSAVEDEVIEDELIDEVDMDVDVNIIRENAYQISMIKIIYRTLISGWTGILVDILVAPYIGVYMLMLAAFIFVMSVSCEVYKYYKTREAEDIVKNLIVNESVQNTELQKELHRWYDVSENKDEYGIYVENTFENEDSIMNKTNNKIYVKGSRRVIHQKESGILLIENKKQISFENYKGYEIGGGSLSLTAFIICCIVLLALKGQRHWILEIFVLMIVTFVSLYVGCKIEIQLRKYNILLPNVILITDATSIALHHIRSLDRYSITDDRNHSVSVDENYYIPSLKMKKIAIGWFNLVLKIYKLFKYVLSWVFYINTAFVMLILVSITFGLLFDLSVNKSNSNIKNETIKIMVFIWLAVSIGFYGIYYLSQGCCCAGKRYCRLSIDNRIVRSKQKTLLILIAIATLCLVVAAILVSIVDDDVYDRWKFTNVTDDAGDSNNNIPTIWDKMNCNTNDSPNSKSHAPPTNSTRRLAAPKYSILTRRMQDIDYANELYCIDDRSNKLNIALFLVFISWYFLIVASYLWRRNDNRTTQVNIKVKNNKERKIMKRLETKWKRYSVINIGLKKRQKSFFSVFASNEKSIQVQLNPDDAYKLHSYLNK